MVQILKKKKSFNYGDIFHLRSCDKTFCYLGMFYDTLDPKNGISLQEHNFLNFMYI